MIKQKESGFSVVEVLIVIVALAIIGFVGWRVYEAQTDNKANTNQTQEKKTTTQYRQPTADEKLLEAALAKHCSLGLPEQSQKAMKAYVSSTLVVGNHAVSTADCAPSGEIGPRTEFRAAFEKSSGTWGVYTQGDTHFKCADFDDKDWPIEITGVCYVLDDNNNYTYRLPL